MNLGTFVVLLIVAALAAAIIAKIVKDKKAGKSAVCGGDCSKCHSTCNHSDR